MAKGQCPICRRQCDIDNLPPPYDGVKINCHRCGHFKLSVSDRRSFEGIEDRKLLPYLSAYIRQNSSFQNPITIDIGNWEQLAGSHKTTSVLQKIERLLRLIAQKTDTLGSEVTFIDDDLPLIDAADFGELHYLLQQIADMGYIKLDTTKNSWPCIMQAKGWERLLKQTISGIPGRCFVAMSFHESLNEAWKKGIYPALKEDCKLDPIRMDKEEHNEKICDKIIANIRQCQFLVADFTRHRPGVYFEAGFALALGRPVIGTCRKDEFTNEKVHFDTRQYNHIVWTSPEDLREKLCDRVLATIPEALPGVS
jgi:hypothetical protein